jgi:hypothetical protein
MTSARPRYPLPNRRHRIIRLLADERIKSQLNSELIDGYTLMRKLSYAFLPNAGF